MRFYTAEEVAAILVADIPWYENGSDVVMIRHLNQTEKNFT